MKLNSHRTVFLIAMVLNLTCTAAIAQIPSSQSQEFEVEDESECAAKCDSEKVKADKKAFDEWEQCVGDGLRPETCDLLKSYAEEQAKYEHDMCMARCKLT